MSLSWLSHLILKQIADVKTRFHNVVSKKEGVSARSKALSHLVGTDPLTINAQTETSSEIKTWAKDGTGALIYTPDEKATADLNALIAEGRSLVIVVQLKNGKYAKPELAGKRPAKASGIVRRSARLRLT